MEKIQSLESKKSYIQLYNENHGKKFSSVIDKRFPIQNPFKLDMTIPILSEEDSKWNSMNIKCFFLIHHHKDILNVLKEMKKNQILAKTMALVHSSDLNELLNEGGFYHKTHELPSTQQAIEILTNLYERNQILLENLPPITSLFQEENSKSHGYTKRLIVTQKRQSVGTEFIKWNDGKHFFTKSEKDLKEDHPSNMMTILIPKHFDEFTS